jgi:two-component system, sensor histidine kinase and response regulator
MGVRMITEDRTGGLPDLEGSTVTLGPPANSRNLEEDFLLAAALRITEPIVIVVDAGGFIGFLNSTAEKILGYLPSSRLGRSVFELIHPDDRAAVQEALTDILRGERSNFVARFQHVDGSWRYLASSAANQFHVPAIKGILIHSRDVTATKEADAALKTQLAELSRARDQADAANIAKSHFLAMITHEIRTSMNGVMGMTSLLADTALDSRQREITATIRSSGDTLLEIVNDLLDFSRIEAGQMTLNSTDLELTTLIEESVDLVAEPAHRKGIELIVKLDNNLPSNVWADGVRLRQILLNLLSNAVKYTEQGQVTIRVSCESEPTKDRAVPDSNSEVKLRFTVTDTGIGIPEEAKAHLFAEFTQPGISNRHQSGGSGLGLAISKRLVELMGGEIGFSSGNRAGSTFWFSLTLKSSGVCEPEAPYTGPARRVLVVDDNAASRDLMEGFLQNAGFQTVSLDRPARCLDLLLSAYHAGKPFHLVILDQQMPVLNGLTLASTISSCRELNGLKIILLASMTRQASLQFPRTASVDATISKPIKRLAFLRSVRSLMEIAPSRKVVAMSPKTPRLSVMGPKLTGTVLLVEDNPASQKVAMLMLQRLGLRVDLAFDGKEAIKAAQKNRYGAILMDCLMPQIDGLEATRRIRAMENPGERTPVIALTANVLETERDKCLQAGMDDYLPKPINPSELAEKLSNWLSKPRAESAQHKAPVVNRELLSEVSQFLGEMYEEMDRGDFFQFLGIVSTRMTSLQGDLVAELARGNLTSAAKTARKLRNSASSVGAGALCDSLLRIEQTLTGGDRFIENTLLRDVQARCVDLTLVLSDLSNRRPLLSPP